MELWDIYDQNRFKTRQTVVRGQPMAPGQYHIVVDVWIRNSVGQFLISRRAHSRPLGGYWETTGGSAIQGEDSLSAALREVCEELGLVLDPGRGRFLFTLRLDQRGNGTSCFRDVWLYDHDMDIAAICCHPEEVAEAKWASALDIKAMREDFRTPTGLPRAAIRQDRADFRNRAVDE